MSGKDSAAGTSSLGRRLADFVAELRRWAEAERARRVTMAEIADLDRQGLLDEALADLNLSRDDLEAIVNADPDMPPRLAAMADRLGVTSGLEDMPKRWSHDLAQVCKSCPRPDECDRWMKSGATEGYERFCDNAQTLTALRERA